jgi:protein ImuB
LVTSFIEAAIARATRQARRAVEQRGQELMESFDRWGVRSFRALAALPVIAVAERLGQDGVQLQKLARGEGVRSLAPAEPPLNFVETLELEYPVENLESLAFALNRMLEQLCARLNSRSLATNELRLELALEDIADRVIEKTVERESEIEVSVAPALLHSRTLRLPVPMRDVRVFLKLLQLDLQEHPPQSPITKITLAFEPVRPQVANHGLFIPVEPQPEKLELMLARIAGIVGEGRVGSAELLDTHRPDSFHMHRFTPSKQAVRKRAKKADGSGPPHVSNTHDGQRPRADGVSMAARIFRPPLPATVQLRNDIPAHVFCTGEQAPRGDVTWVAGPWCSSGEWWKQQASQKDDAAGAATSWSREEWDVSIAGALYRLVRNLDSGDWFIEAMYD